MQQSSSSFLTLTSKSSTLRQYTANGSGNQPYIVEFQEFASKEDVEGCCFPPHLKLIHLRRLTSVVRVIENVRYAPTAKATREGNKF